MSKKNIPTDLPSANASSALSDTVIVPEAQPLLPLLKTDNGKSGGSAAFGTPLDSIKEYEKGQQEEEAFGATVSYQNKKVLGLWTKAETRNAWANIQDLGWKKFYSGSDSSVVAFTIIAGNALEKQTLVNITLENDQIIEMYVW